MTVSSYDPRAIDAMMTRLKRIALSTEDADTKEHLLALVENVESSSLDSDLSAAARYFRDVATQPAQQASLDRNSWQRRLGALVTMVEHECRVADQAGVGVDPIDLLARTYKVINTNPMTQTIDEPYADIAKLITRQTLEACLAAGLVSPGPQAPDWMKDDEAAEDKP